MRFFSCSDACRVYILVQNAHLLICEARILIRFKCVFESPEFWSYTLTLPLSNGDFERKMRFVSVFYIGLGDHIGIATKKEHLVKLQYFVY